MDRYLQDLLESGTPTGRMPLQGIDTPVRAPIPQQDPNSFAAPTRTKAAQNVLRTALGLNTPGSFTQKAMELLSGLQELNDPAGGTGPSKAILAGSRAIGAPELRLEEFMKRVGNRPIQAALPTREAQRNWNDLGVTMGIEGKPRWETSWDAVDVPLFRKTLSRVLEKAPKSGTRDMEGLTEFLNLLGGEPEALAKMPIGAVTTKEFAKAYPQIAARRLHIEMPYDLPGAGFSPTTKNIYLNPGKRSSPSPYFSPASMLEHELQHAVQLEERFAPGANMNLDPMDAPPVTKEFIKKMHRVISKMISPEHARGAITSPERESVLNYFASGGETEARNIQRRQMNPALRSQVPARTEDLSRLYQWVPEFNPEWNIK